MNRLLEAITWTGALQALIAVPTVILTLCVLGRFALAGDTWAIGVLVAMTIGVFAVYGIKVSIQR